MGSLARGRASPCSSSLPHFHLFVMPAHAGMKVFTAIRVERGGALRDPACGRAYRPGVAIGRVGALGASGPTAVGLMTAGGAGRWVARAAGVAVASPAPAGPRPPVCPPAGRGVAAPLGAVVDGGRAAAFARAGPGAGLAPGRATFGGTGPGFGLGEPKTTGEARPRTTVSTVRSGVG